MLFFFTKITHVIKWMNYVLKYRIKLIKRKTHRKRRNGFAVHKSLQHSWGCYNSLPAGTECLLTNHIAWWVLGKNSAWRCSHVPLPAGSSETSEQAVHLAPSSGSEISGAVTYQRWATAGCWLQVFFSIGDGMRLRFSASPMKGLFSVCIKQLGEFGASTVCWNPSVVLNSRALTRYIFHGSQVNTTHGLRATPPSNQKNRGARRKDYCGFEMCSALNLL